MTVGLLPKAPDRLACRKLRSLAELDSPPPGVDILTVPAAWNGFYRVGFAVSPESIRRTMRLRYEVFNEELGEGLMASRATGLDSDEFDERMHHIVLLNRADKVIGTYRVQTAEHGAAAGGLYCARGYRLDNLMPLFPRLIECGRACIARESRNYPAIMLLWKGLAAYLELTQTRWLFGCCSLTTLDSADGWRALRQLRATGAVDESLCEPVPEFSCGPAALEFDGSIPGDVKIPKLFRAYIHLGARVVSLPSIDREFGTVDFLVMLDRERVNFANLAARR